VGPGLRRDDEVEKLHRVVRASSASSAVKRFFFPRLAVSLPHCELTKPLCPLCLCGELNARNHHSDRHRHRARLPEADNRRTAAHQYDLTYLRRGVYGTPIGAHAAGGSFARFGPNDPSLFKYVYPASFIGQTIHVKLPAFNIFGQSLQGLAGLTPTSYSLTGDGAIAGPAYVSGSWSGSPAASQIIERYIFATPVNFPAG